MALELRSQLCTFDNSANFNEISFDPHLFSEYLKGLFMVLLIILKASDNSSRTSFHKS